MTASEFDGTRFVRNRRGSETGVFVLAALAAILAMAYLAYAGEPERIKKEIRLKEKKLREVKKYIAENYDSLVEKRDGGEQTEKIEAKPLLTVVKETAQKTGLTGYLAGVNMEENKKLGEVTAKVVLRGVRLADVINFLVYIRSKHPGISDREGRMRLLPRQQGDNWDALLSLTTRIR